MFGILGFGFLLGMQHALEADHIAAVSSIAARRAKISEIAKHGLTWGLGHTLTLLLFVGASIALGHAIPEKLARTFEIGVGVMLIGLGGQVLWRMWRERVHFHVHVHTNGIVKHIHAHSHLDDVTSHRDGLHTHEHGFRWRTMFVGLMHGMAGSAALLLLAVSQFESPISALLYVAIFGVGSILGMGALSTAIAVPLALSARSLTWVNRGLQGTIGVTAIIIGGTMAYEMLFN